MSLGETSKLLLESQKIFDSSEDLNTNTPVILNMLLQLVSSIDGRLKSIETAVDSIKDIKRELLLMLEDIQISAVKGQFQNFSR